jgi:sialate O-acetylesterase
MLSRVASFPARGMLWYQGETEGFDDRAFYYANALEALVKQMRHHQNLNPVGKANPDFAFHYVQIAPFINEGAKTWADVCNQQREFTIKNPHHAMITTGDIGGGTDIHPPKKQPVGERLAAAALNKTYNATDAEFTGPIATDATFKDGEIQINFQHADGLHFTENPGKFQLIYSDKTIEAAPIIKSNAVYLPCESKPDAVQYEYVSAPSIGLYNSVGLPASVFKVITL